MKRLRAADPQATTALFTRFVDSIERAVMGVLGNDPDVEDVVQDTFIVALRDIKKFRSEEDRLEAWLRGIAIRLALRKLRWRRTRQWSVWLGTDSMTALRAVDDPNTQAALERAYAALDRLPATERAAFGLRFIEGMQLEEIAEALGISLATTKRKIRNARQRFTRLADQDPLLCDWQTNRGTHGT